MWLNSTSMKKILAFLRYCKNAQLIFIFMKRNSNLFLLKIQIGFRESRPHRGDDFASPLSAFATISFEGIFPGDNIINILRASKIP